MGVEILMQNLLGFGIIVLVFYAIWVKATGRNITEVLKNRIRFKNENRSQNRGPLI